MTSKEAAELIGAQKGLTADQVLEKATEIIREIPFSNQCLYPSDVNEFVRRNEVPSEVVEHVKKCAMCRSLLRRGPHRSETIIENLWKTEDSE
jgi:hypothetical protein